uniref:Uncharacterized protein n=1 Tax=Grammatophora oceanica TaxID=210454 RepID=A0A7S1Y7Y5_9STRA|mmetsp:Transcript_3613/g.4920  ORF Transcript_3613/g.4920 Transcript_3613/m.4920 type:complete len:127 (+) Transcript_3613:283-663(+)
MVPLHNASNLSRMPAFSQMSTSQPFETGKKSSTCLPLGQVPPANGSYPHEMAESKSDSEIRQLREYVTIGKGVRNQRIEREDLMDYFPRFRKISGENDGVGWRLNHQFEERTKISNTGLWMIGGVS